MTTEGAASSRRRRASVSVRTRIAISVAVLSALALGIAGALVYTLESNRIRADITAKIDQEMAELAALQREGVDPETGERFTAVTRLLDTFLVRNVPDDDEMLVGYWSGRYRGAHPAPLRRGRRQLTRVYQAAVREPALRKAAPRGCELPARRRPRG